MSEWIDGWMDRRTVEWINGWMDGWMDEWTDEWTDECMDGQVNEIRKDGQNRKRMKGRLY